MSSIDDSYRLCMSVIALPATYIPRLYVENRLFMTILTRSLKILSSKVLVTFADPPIVSNVWTYSQ